VNPEGTGDAPTIQAALDAAEAGDVVRLAPGIYRDLVERKLNGDDAEAVAFLKPGVSLEGEDGALFTFIDGEEDHRCLAGEDLDPSTEIRGVTLIHGDALDGSKPNGGIGGGLLLYRSSPLLRDIRFVGCNAVEGGGGLCVRRGFEDDRLDLGGCAFIFCWTGVRGGGAELVDVEDADVKHNTFAGNFAVADGGGIAVVDMPAWVDNNVFWWNCSHESGGSIWCERADVVAECNVFWENFPEVDDDATGCTIGDDEPNFIADPLFCDRAAEDFSIDAASPASEENSGVCGAIGAYGVACEVKTRHLTSTCVLLEDAEGHGAGGAVGRDREEAAAATPSLVIRARPNPTSGAVRFVVQGTKEATAVAEILDVRGRRVRRLGAAGGDGLAWDGRDETGRRVADGIYFARVTAVGRSELVRIVVVRR